ncbi:MAG: phage portal protein [Deltaproteobacteria bacterium]|nr:phage portal protein [Deltaproteobacteria bacterium]
MPPVESTGNAATPINLSTAGFGLGMMQSLFSGEKYPGGLDTQLDFFYIDYWTLRRRSYRLFTENRYAKGLISRLVTNVIHRGLTLEATPSGSILGKSDDFINDWTDDVEAKFDIWADIKELVSYKHALTFGDAQEEAYRTALLSGDALIVLRQHPVTRLPQIEIIDGIHVRNPLDSKTKNQIKHGVEFDSKGRQIAYYVQDKSDPIGMKSIRIPARGPKSGRRIAWLVYGHKIKIDDVRGMPILGIVMQALKELDRYSDAEQRAAVLNSIVAMFVKKGQERMGSRPFTSGATRRDQVQVQDTSETAPRTWNINQYLPGLVMNELQYGEEPVPFNTQRPNTNYGGFEEAITASIAWALEMPPNIYRLAFSSNYSASGGEINEFKMFLDKERTRFATKFTKPVYKEWLVSMTLLGLIEADGLLEAWRNPLQFLISGAWFQSEWSGAIKPSLRRNQDIKGYVDAIREGLATRDQATKEIFGRKYTTVVKRLKKENDSLVSSLQPLIDSGLIKTDPPDTQTILEDIDAA